MTADKELLDKLIANNTVKTAFNDRMFIGWVNEDTPLPALTVNILDKEPINTLTSSNSSFVNVRINIWDKSTTKARDLADSVETALSEYHRSFTDYVVEDDPEITHVIISYSIPE